MELETQIQNSNTYNGFITDTAVGSGISLPATTSNWVTYTYGWPYYESKTEKAYQVLRALMKAKIIKIKELEEFFSAMDEIVKVI